MSSFLTFFSAAALLHSDDSRLVPQAPLLILRPQEAEAAIGPAVAAADGHGGLRAGAGAPRPVPRGPLAEEAVGAKASGAARLALPGRAFPAAAAAVGLEKAPDGGAGLGRARRASRPVASCRAGQSPRRRHDREGRQEEQQAEQGWPRGCSHGRRRGARGGRAEELLRRLGHPRGQRFLPNGRRASFIEGGLEGRGQEGRGKEGEPTVLCGHKGGPWILNREGGGEMPGFQKQPPGTVGNWHERAKRASFSQALEEFYLKNIEAKHNENPTYPRPR